MNSYEEFKARTATALHVKREKRGLTQEKLAEHVGITTGFLGQIERGISTPGLKNFFELITTLGIDPRPLFYGTAQDDTDYAELCAIMVQMTPDQRKFLLNMARLFRDYSL